MIEQIKSFQNNYGRRMWCLVECNKLIKPAGGRNLFAVRKLRSWLCQVCLFVQAAGPVLTYKLYVMHKQTVKSNIVYDSYSDKTWNMEQFFELLADHYNGNLNELCEQLITAVETLNHMPDDAILSEMAKASTLNLLIVRECLIGISPTISNE